jgi:endonuclease YncB( thermonuclease family)
MLLKSLAQQQNLFPISHVRIIDGDTLEATIHLPFEQNLTTRIRLKGWWADELDGPYRGAGLVARFRLESFCDGKALWIQSTSGRKDKYGRIVATLWHSGRIVAGKEVLGDLQLTEATHKLHRDQARQQASRAQKWPGDVKGADFEEDRRERPPGPEEAYG